MSTSTTPESVEFQPHRRWYRRPEVMLPLAAVLALYVFLIFFVEEESFFRTDSSPDGTVTWDWGYFFSLWPLMLKGLAVTAKATVLGFTVSVVLGFVLAMGRRAEQRWISWPFAVIIEFIRSTPLLVQLFFALALARTVEAISSDGVFVLTATLGIHYATYCSEAYRAGINSVPKGQWEAATALNLSTWTTWTQIVIPQAVPNVLPSLGNFLVAGFKDAPLGFIVGVSGILAFANTVRSSDFRAQEPYIMAGVGFLIVSLAAAWLVRRLEDRIAYERT